MDFQKVIQEYNANGAVLFRDCLPEEWVQKVATAIEKVYHTPAKDTKYCSIGGGAITNFRDFANWQNVSELKEVVTESPIPKLVGQLMNSRTVTLFYDQIIVKDPRDLDLTAFHVEMSHYPFVGDQGCSVVVPIDVVPLETTLKFVQGSHLWGKSYYPKGIAKDSLTDENRRAECEHVPDVRTLKEAMILEWTMSPGDVLVYNMKTLVAANGNVTNNIQRTLVTHYLGDDIKFAERTWPIFPPLTGKLKVGDHPSNDPLTFPLVYPRPVPEQ